MSEAAHWELRIYVMALLYGFNKDEASSAIHVCRCARRNMRASKIWRARCGLLDATTIGNTAHPSICAVSGYTESSYVEILVTISHITTQKCVCVIFVCFAIPTLWWVPKKNGLDARECLMPSKKRSWSALEAGPPMWVWLNCHLRPDWHALTTRSAQ